MFYRRKLVQFFNHKSSTLQSDSNSNAFSTIPEMEECAIPTSTTIIAAAVENGDPGSRDSGISIGALSLSSANENSSSPLKKRQRQSSSDGGKLQCPTDFSFLHQVILSSVTLKLKA